MSLKIPDNTAYTAAVALRRLGVAIGKLERSEVRFYDDAGDEGALLARITAHETIFNPNKHRVTVLGEAVPRTGEVWIERLEYDVCHSELVDDAATATAWRLFDENGAPLERSALCMAVERLLCNPAIDRVILRQAQDDNRQVQEAVARCG